MRAICSACSPEGPEVPTLDDVPPGGDSFGFGADVLARLVIGLGSTNDARPRSPVLSPATLPRLRSIFIVSGCHSIPPPTRASVPVAHS
jgi:hypothetical protein